MFIFCIVCEKSIQYLHVRNIDSAFDFLESLREC